MNEFDETRIPEDAGEYAMDLKAILNRIVTGRGRFLEVSAGWYPLIAKLNIDIAKIAPNYEVYQVKEKFGGLRYYIGPLNKKIADEVYKLIAQAERESFKICEICGAAGALRGRTWVRTTCEEHSEGEPLQVFETDSN